MSATHSSVSVKDKFENEKKSFLFPNTARKGVTFRSWEYAKFCDSV